MQLKWKMVPSQFIKYAIAIGLLVSTANCSSELARDEAEKLIRAQLEQESVVNEIQVRGVALRQLLEGNYLALSPRERWCGISECSDLSVGDKGGDAFTEAKGQFYKRMPNDNSVILTLAQPLIPQVQITGLTSDDSGRSAVVEFGYSYPLPDVIAGLDVTAQTQSFGMTVSASGIRISRRGLPGANLIDPHNSRWRFQLYDDGWRIAGKN